MRPHWIWTIHWDMNKPKSCCPWNPEQKAMMPSGSPRWPSAKTEPNQGHLPCLEFATTGLGWIYRSKINHFCADASHPYSRKNPARPGGP